MSEENKNKTNSGLYVAVFFVCIIFIIMLFFVKKDTILANLKKTNFFERVGVSTPEFVQNHADAPKIPVKEEEYEFDLMGGTTKTTSLEPEEPVAQAPETASSRGDGYYVGSGAGGAKADATSGAEGGQARNVELASAQKKPAQDSSEAVKTPVQPVTVRTADASEGAKVPVAVPATRSANLCFVSIDADGRVNRRVITRSLPKSDSPLTDAIRALIAGPLPGEANCMSLIPSGTKLIGASVKDGVATLNFNENFEFNSYGVEGWRAQLMQIVYTATEFSTVKSVQFLIEGEKKSYLGEGQWIGSPLSRLNVNS